MPRMIRLAHAPRRPAVNTVVRSSGARYDIADLARIVAAASGADNVVFDEQYAFTAWVVRRRILDGDQTLLVELLDRGPDEGDARWLATAHDEFADICLTPASGPTPAAALAALNWSAFGAP